MSVALDTQLPYTEVINLTIFSLILSPIQIHISPALTQMMSSSALFCTLPFTFALSWKLYFLTTHS